MISYADLCTDLHKGGRKLQSDMKDRWGSSCSGKLCGSTSLSHCKFDIVTFYTISNGVITLCVQSHGMWHRTAYNKTYQQNFTQRPVLIPFPFNNRLSLLPMSGSRWDWAPQSRTPYPSPHVFQTCSKCLLFLLLLPLSKDNLPLSGLDVFIFVLHN